LIGRATNTSPTGRGQRSWGVGPGLPHIRLERELRRRPAGELRELAGIYEQRGLPPALASEVAQPLRTRPGAEGTMVSAW
jgi:hypothetical protein